LKKPDLESGSQFYLGVKPELLFLKKKKKKLKSGVDQRLTKSQLPIKLVRSEQEPGPMFKTKTRIDFCNNQGSKPNSGFHFCEESECR